MTNLNIYKPSEFFEKWYLPAPEAPSKPERSAGGESGPSRSTTDGEVSPFEWLRDHWDWHEELGADGWPFMGVIPGEGPAFNHPGKPASDGGKSAFAERSGHHPLRIMSTSPTLDHLRNFNGPDDGAMRPLSPGQYLAAHRFGGDSAAAARWVRKALMPAVAGVNRRVLELANEGRHPEAIELWLGRSTVAELGGDVETQATIRTSGRYDTDVVNDVMVALTADNDPPHLLLHGITPTRFVYGRLAPLDADGIHAYVDETVRLYKMNAKGDISPSKLSPDQRKMLLARFERPEFPRLQALAPSPFLRPDGTICDTVGYDHSTGMYLLDHLDVDVPEHPSPRAVAAAVELIDEMICDFPLPTAADRAHVYSALLTPAIRHLVRLVPLHLFDGNGPGVGKNLLVESLLRIHFGDVSTTAMPTDDDELRKQVSSAIMAGRRVMLWDEAHILMGNQLARLITSERWQDRALGGNTMIDMPNLITAYALGNSVEVVGDIRRRTVRVAVHSSSDAPGLRTEYRHPNLPAWVEENRSALLSAVLTMLRAWAVAGKPHPSDVALGSFEQWVHVIGGTLQVAGIDGFLTGRSELMEMADHLEAEFAAHLEQLHAHFGSTEFRIKDVVAHYRGAFLFDDPELPSGIRPDAHDASEKLGKLYRRYRDRPLRGEGGVNAIRRVGMTHGNIRWSVDHLQ